MNIKIVTGDDWALAGNIVKQLDELKNYKVEFVTVTSEKSDSISKKFKLIFLFGFLGTLKMFLTTLSMKWRFKYGKLKHIKLTKITKENVDQGHLGLPADSVFLINYPWKINCELYGTIFNCHPSELPKFRGLMPVCHSLIESLKEGSITTGASIHIIDSNFDCGELIWTQARQHKYNASLYDIYMDTYKEFVTGIVETVTTNKNAGVNLERTAYYKAMTWREVINLKFHMLKRNSFVRFMLNGAIMGLFSWALQYFFFIILNDYAFYFKYKLATSVWLSFCIVLFINYFSQRKLVFKRSGNFFSFLTATLIAILLVGILAEFVLTHLVNAGFENLSFLAYPIAALTIAPLTFLAKRNFVFRG